MLVCYFKFTMQFLHYPKHFTFFLFERSSVGLFRLQIRDKLHRLSLWRENHSIWELAPEKLLVRLLNYCNHFRGSSVSVFNGIDNSEEAFSPVHANSKKSSVPQTAFVPIASMSSKRIKTPMGKKRRISDFVKKK